MGKKKNQGQGLDMQVWLVCVLFFLMAAAISLSNWIVSPALQDAGQELYSLQELSRIPDDLVKTSQMGKLAGELILTNGQMDTWTSILQGIFYVESGIAIAFILYGILAGFKKRKVKALGSLLLIIQTLLILAEAGILVFANWNLNGMLNRENSFVNLTIHSYLQLTAWPYAILMIGILLQLFLPRLLNTQQDQSADRTKRHLGARAKGAFLLTLIGVPFSIFFGIWFLNDRSYYFISLCIIFWCMVPFFGLFEDRHPQARELVVIAVLVALAVAGRAAFFMVPQFKPMMAIVIIAGVAMGPETGFLTGALSAFTSNFFFGQGPWTPWQMLAFGLVGFLAGVIFGGKRRKWADRKVLLAVFGGVATFLFYGLIMDTASVLMYTSKPTWGALLTMYASGAVFNLIHGASTVIFLLLLSGPMLKKLNRVRIKYGLLTVREMESLS